MAPQEPIVVGIDGSDPSRHAVEWVARYATATHAPVVAVHAVEYPVLLPIMGAWYQSPIVTPEHRDNIVDVCQRDYCKPLADSGVAFEVVVQEGYPAATIMNVAQARSAGLVAVGRRGQGGFAEMLLGSTSHELTLHLGRPLVIIP
jgi:nucleotide-binding universal stress UspA family protein